LVIVYCILCFALLSFTFVSIPVLASRPILACGSVFEITEAHTPKAAVKKAKVNEEDNTTGTVQTTAITSDPEKTAMEISKRLFIRLQSGSATLNPCSPS
jgi:hypothetical protein